MEERQKYTKNVKRNEIIILLLGIEGNLIGEKFLWEFNQAVRLKLYKYKGLYLALASSVTRYFISKTEYFWHRNNSKGSRFMVCDRKKRSSG